MIRYYHKINELVRPGIVLGLILTIAVPIGAAAEGTPAGSPLPTISGTLTIADAVQTALKHSPMVQSARYQTSAAQARVGMARGETRPQIAATGFAGTSTMGDLISSPPNVMPSSILGVPDKSGVTAQVGLMFPLYTGGRLSAAVKASRALSSAAASDQASVERNASLEVKTAYHRALLAQAAVGVYENLVKEEQERVRIADVSYREGRIAKYDLLRNQAGLAEAQQQLNNVERDAQMAVVEFKAAMGVDQTSDIKLTDRLAYDRIPDTAETYLALALKNRSELAAARARVSSADADVEAARSAYKPQVYASAMQGATGVPGESSSGFTAGVTIGFPIIDGGQRSSAVKEAGAMVQVMKQEEYQAYLGIQRDVSAVWAELLSADKNVGLSQTAVAQAEEDYRVVKLRYEAGKTVNVEVLDALASLVRAQNNQLMALYEHNVARDRLARAIGEL